MIMEPQEDNQFGKRPNDASSDEDDDVDEADAKLRSIHFLKRNEEFSSHDYTDGNGPAAAAKPNRYDEMSSFLTRSQRSISHPDMPPSPEEAAQRRVNMKDDVVDVVHEMEPLSEAESSLLHGEEDFRRVDIDVELTTMRWEKSQKNKTKHDEDQNPTRGLEEMLDTKKIRSALRKKHRQAVLTEMVRQKTSGSFHELNWEKIRAVAEPFSKETAQIAYKIALQDAGLSKGPSRRNKITASPAAAKTKKKGGGLFGMFKKK